MIAIHGKPHRTCTSTKDDELKRRVLNYLRHRLPHITAVEVQAQNGTAILRGIVPSQSLQWRCRECCRYVAGVLKVIDQLMVLPNHELSVASNVTIGVEMQP